MLKFLFIILFFLQFYSSFSLKQNFLHSNNYVQNLRTSSSPQFISSSVSTSQNALNIQPENFPSTEFKSSLAFSKQELEDDDNNDTTSNKKKRNDLAYDYRITALVGSLVAFLVVIYTLFQLISYIRKRKEYNDQKELQKKLREFEKLSKIEIKKKRKLKKKIKKDLEKKRAKRFSEGLSTTSSLSNFSNGTFSDLSSDSSDNEEVLTPVSGLQIELPFGDDNIDLEAASPVLED